MQDLWGWNDCISMAINLLEKKNQKEEEDYGDDHKGQRKPGKVEEQVPGEFGVTF